ncbi:MAG TPA: hypothetical protein VF544_18355 [Pyrinomonadaceae bacterium]|jgi:hypothetical protein
MSSTINKGEKERLIKEIRLVVLRDVHAAMAQMEDQSNDKGLSGIARHVGQYINERAAEVANDTADKPRQQVSKRGEKK